MNRQNVRVNSKSYYPIFLLGLFMLGIFFWTSALSEDVFSGIFPDSTKFANSQTLTAAPAIQGHQILEGDEYDVLNESSGLSGSIALIVALLLLLGALAVFFFSKEKN